MFALAMLGGAGAANASIIGAHVGPVGIGLGIHGHHHHYRCRYHCHR
jgi:hypothetical protein